MAEQVRESRIGVTDLGFRIVDQHLKVSLGLIEKPDTLGVFIEFAGIVGAGKEVLENQRMRDSNRLGVLHCRPKLAAGNLLVAVEFDVADFNLGALLDDKVD